MRSSAQCLTGAPLFLSSFMLHLGRLRHSVQKVLKTAGEDEGLQGTGQALHWCVGIWVLALSEWGVLSKSLFSEPHLLHL